MDAKETKAKQLRAKADSLTSEAEALTEEAKAHKLRAEATCKEEAEPSEAGSWKLWQEL